MLLLVAAQKVILEVPESSGISTESILVFVGGVVAAVAAVIAAVVTARSANARLKQSLSEERERSEKQFEHERYLVRRAEASTAVENTARLIAQTVSALSPLLLQIFGEGAEKEEQHDEFWNNLARIREETNVIALRFGSNSTLVERILDVVNALDDSLPEPDELPLSPDRQKEIKAARREVGLANAEFMKEAEKALRGY